MSRLIADWLEHIPTNRQSRIDHITGLILSLKPDAFESTEILEALEVALIRRYEGDETEALHYSNHLKQALDRLDRDEQTNMKDDDDWAYEDHIARRVL
jgi:hypothetical protein